MTGEPIPEGTIAWVIPHYHFWLNPDGSTKQNYIDEGIHNECECKPVIAQLENRWAPTSGTAQWWGFGDERPYDEDAPNSIEVLRVIDVGKPDAP